MAFDLVVEMTHGRGYASFDTASEVCTSCGLQFAAPLLRGTLAACLDFNIEFDSTIPARLGLPALGGTERNLAEGVVIRPQTEPVRPAAESRAPSGKESMRGLFKRKIPQFSEKKYQNNDFKKGRAGGGGRGNCTVNDEELT